MKLPKKVTWVMSPPPIPEVQLKVGREAEAQKPCDHERSDAHLLALVHWGEGEGLSLKFIKV